MGLDAADSQDSSELPPDPHSSFKLSVCFTVGYERKREMFTSGFEASAVSIGLLLGGFAVVLIIIDVLVRLLGLHLFT